MARSIHLEDLTAMTLTVTEEGSGYYRQSCMVCFDDQDHASGVEMAVEFIDVQEIVTVFWEGTVDDRLRASYRDPRKRVDFGSCTLALMLMHELSDYYAVELTWTGDAVDYYLAAKDDDENFILANLEVSGIQKEQDYNTINSRISDKRAGLRRIAGSPTATTKDVPTYICIVEYAQPKAKAVIA